MKKFHLLDVSTSDYFTGHSLPVICTFYDGRQLTRAEVREQLDAEIDGDQYSDTEVNEAFNNWDADGEPNELFFKHDQDICDAVEADEELFTCFWVIQ